jgi:hypothetical protein
MLKKTQQIALAFLLLFVSLNAQSVSVWTLDEQLSSDNLTVLRFRVQNTGQQIIRGLELHYRVKQDWSGIAPVEGYYVPSGNTEWVQLSGGEALLKISFPNAVLEPMEELSNSSGFSVGLHTKDWSAWNKQEHYSQPISGVFTLTDRISVYSNGVLLNGETASNVACPNVWFLEIQTDSVKIGWLPSDSQEEQKILELRSFNGASLEVDLTQAADSGGYKEWSSAFPVQFENHGELWVNCSGKMKQNYKPALMQTKIYNPLLSSFKMDTISGDRHIPSGQTLTLKPGSYMQNIVVSSGSLLRLQPGSYKMGSLTVQSGGKIELLGSGKIALDIAGLFRWDGAFQGDDILNVASRLKIRILGKQDIFLNTSFGGFLIAPNAHVVVGQADKDYAGQIYAKRITLHQNTRFLWVQPGSKQTNIAAFNRGAIYARFNK